jgi:hypothetical protein
MPRGLITNVKNGTLPPDPLSPETIKAQTRKRASWASIRQSHHKYRSATATFCEQIAFFFNTDLFGDEVETKL